VYSVLAGLVLKIALGYILRFLGFLGASRDPLNSINRPVNTEKERINFREELTAVQRSLFLGLFFSFLFHYEDV
jgi:hypothetical protein